VRTQRFPGGAPDLGAKPQTVGLPGFRALISGDVEGLQLVRTSVALLKRRALLYHKSYARSAEVRVPPGHISASGRAAVDGPRDREATGGVVTRFYVTNLRKGRIENPGYEKMKALAKAMGFAPQV
jgi:hypothetical protein